MKMHLLMCGKIWSRMQVSILRLPRGLWLSKKNHLIFLVQKLGENLVAILDRKCTSCTFQTMVHKVFNYFTCEPVCDTHPLFCSVHLCISYFFTVTFEINIKVPINPKLLFS